MIWNIEIEVPDVLGYQILSHISQKRKIPLSSPPTPEEVNAISQQIANEIIEKNRNELAQKAAEAAYEAAYEGVVVE